MKALSHVQPLAQLIVLGEKRMDVRSSHHPHRGKLLVHASKTWTDVCIGFCQLSPCKESLQLGNGSSLHFGCLLGTVDLIVCDQVNRMRNFGWKEAGIDEEKERAFNHPIYTGSTDWCLIFANPVMFAKPIPYRGRPGIFNVPDEVLQGAL